MMAYSLRSFSAWYFQYESIVMRNGSSNLSQSWILMPSYSV